MLMTRWIPIPILLMPAQSPESTGPILDEPVFELILARQMMATTILMIKMMDVRNAAAAVPNFQPVGIHLRPFLPISLELGMNGTAGSIPSWSSASAFFVSCVISNIFAFLSRWPNAITESYCDNRQRSAVCGKFFHEPAEKYNIHGLQPLCMLRPTGFTIGADLHCLAKKQWWFSWWRAIALLGSNKAVFIVQPRIPCPR